MHSDKLLLKAKNNVVNRLQIIIGWRASGPVLTALSMWMVYG